MQYEVFEAPPFLLEHGHYAYIRGFGVVCLLEIAVRTTKRSKEWKVFQCVQEEHMVAKIAAHQRWCKIQKRDLKLFGVSFLFVSSTKSLPTHLGWI